MKKHTNIAYISLGSNAGDSVSLLAKAIQGINKADGLDVLYASACFCTEPQDFKEQNWFYNQVITVNCQYNWTALTLLTFMLEVENSLGRMRSNDVNLRYGPRSMDLDLLLFGQEESDNPLCILPHPRMWQRAFVLIPLLDVVQQAVFEGKILSDCRLLQKIHMALAILDYTVSGNKIYQN